jgi:hypothetical protein
LLSEDLGDAAATSLAVGSDPASTGDLRLSADSAINWKHPGSGLVGASIVQESIGDGITITWSNLGDNADRTLKLFGRGSVPLWDATFLSYAGTATPAVRYDLSGSGGLTAASGQQTGFQYKVDVTQSGTAGFLGFDVLVNTFTKGSGTARLLSVQDDAGTGLQLFDNGYTYLQSATGGSTLLLSGPASTNTQVQVNYGSDTDRRLIIAGNVLYTRDSAGTLQNLAVGNGGASSLVISSSSGHGIRLGSVTGPLVTWGAGSPESVVTAPIGSTYHRTDGGAATSFYVKEAGTGNTGWVAK